MKRKTVEQEENDIVSIENIISQLKKIKPENQVLDDIGLADIFIDLYGHLCRYCREDGMWFAYNGKYWVSEAKKANIAMYYLKDFQRNLCEYAGYIEDLEKRTSFLKNILTYGNHKRLVNLLSCAESCKPISRDDFDKNADLFNCQNGTLNLKTGEFRDHDYKDLLTKISNVEYKPEIKYGLFPEIFNVIMDGNDELIRYVQRMLGYSLTEDSSLEIFFICWGDTTRNGKSTVLETVTRMLGDYAESLDPSSLSLDNTKGKKGSAATPDMYKLKKIRFCTVREPERQLTLSSSQLKSLTGNDTLTSRTLYSAKELKFVPCCKLWFNTNWKFKINDVTLFDSNRVRLIPFKHHFEESEQDKTLKDRLATPENISGLFNWCLDGLKEFRRIGESEPDEIKHLIKDYEIEEDSILNFLTNCMKEKIDPKTHKPVNSNGSAIYKCYQEWCYRNDLPKVGKRRFNEECRKKHIMGTGQVNGQKDCNAILGLVYSPE